MKIWDRITRIFRRNRMEEDRRKELNYRLKAADARRRANKMKRDAENARNEAVRLERAGDHQGAVSKALKAKNYEQQYQSAMKSIRDCENVHEQVNANAGMVELMEACNNMASEVTGQVNMDEIAKVQETFRGTAVQLETLQETLKIMQEGMSPDADPAARDAEGEEALAAILGAAQPEKPAVPAVLAASEVAEKDAGEEAEDESGYREYLNDKRKELAEML